MLPKAKHSTPFSFFSLSSFFCSCQSADMTIGGLLSPLIIKYFLKSRQFTAKFYIMIILFHSSIMTLWGNISHPVISFALLIIGGIFFSSVGIILNTYLQENVEKQYIGRIFSLYRMLMILGAIIGILLAPVLLEIGNASLGFAIILAVSLLALIFSGLLKKSSNFSSKFGH